MKVILSGFLFGLTIAFSFGPGFWALLQETINKGFGRGMLFLTGFFLSDFTFMLIALFLAKSFASGLANSIWLGYIASIVLVSFGIITLLKKKDKTININKKELPLYIKHIGNVLRGYLFNSSNPFNLLFWLGIVTLSSSSYGLNTFNMYMFMTTIFITSFALDVLKCFFASRLQKILNEKFLFLINKLVGVVMICSGFFIFWKMCL